jgi:hypothetical protein
MNMLYMPVLLGVLTFAFGPLFAQEKAVPNAKSSMQPGTHRFVSNDEVLTHGDAVTITRKAGAAKVSGVFVYADEKSGRIFVRPQPGQPPVAVVARDIDKIDRITPASGRADKGGIRPAIDTGATPAPTYEIHEMRGYNGPYMAVYFDGSSVSAEERKRLLAIEQGSTDVVRKSVLVASLRQAIQEAVSELTTTDYGNIPYNALPYYPMAYPVFYSGNILFIVPAPIVDTRRDVTNSLAKLTKSLSEAEVALATARKNYDVARNWAVYEPGGHIVAVRLED